MPFWSRTIFILFILLDFGTYLIFKCKYTKYYEIYCGMFAIHNIFTRECLLSNSIIDILII